MISDISKPNNVVLKTLRCPSCGDNREYVTKEVEFSNGTLHVEATCKDCHKWIKYISFVSPEDFVMPFGKHKGEKIADIAKTDRPYLEWLEENSKRNIADKVKYILSL